MSTNACMNARPYSAEGRAQDLEERLTKIASAGPSAIDARIAELDDEWSAGRVAKSILALTILLGTVLTLTVSWWWAILPAVAGLLLVQYLFTHTSLLVSGLQQFGYRTKADIEHEKFALRTLRGDFRALPTLHDIEDQDDITRLEGEGGIVMEVEDRKVAPKDAVKEVIQATTPHAPTAV